MVSEIGWFIMLIGIIATIWRALWLVLTQAGILGAKLSKKVGTDNERTDEHIETGKNFREELITGILARGLIVLIGFLMYKFGG